VLRAQREEAKTAMVADDRAVGRVLAGKMHLEWGDRMAADSSAAAHENLKLVHIMKVRPDHASVAAFRQERLRIDRARRRRHEVRSPGKFSVRQHALGARCFDILESYYIRHVVLPIDEAAILTPRQAARQNAGLSSLRGALGHEPSGRLTALQPLRAGAAQKRPLLEVEALQLQLPLVGVEALLDRGRGMRPAANAFALELLMLELLLFHALTQLQLFEPKGVRRRKVGA
jgi:hypothetical protein